MIDEYLIRIEEYLKDIKKMVEGLSVQPNAIKLNVPEQPQLPLEPFSESKAVSPYLNEFNELQRLLGTSEWIEAVPPLLICDENSLEERKLRAEGIMDFMIEEPLNGKKFLDFGCGEGFCLSEATKRKASLAIGYDIKKQWDDKVQQATVQWNDVKNQGPYDYVFVYDVLDHAEGDPEDILRKIREVCHSGTVIRIRCHPWCSRSGTHAYRSLNKAFLHLVFTDVELIKLGITESYPTVKVIHPFMNYKNWFNDSGFEIVKEEPIIEELNKFFEENLIISNRIKKNWSKSPDSQLSTGLVFPSYQMKIVFIDYVLKIK